MNRRSLLASLLVAPMALVSAFRSWFAVDRVTKDTIANRFDPSLSYKPLPEDAPKEFDVVSDWWKKLYIELWRRDFPVDPVKLAKALELNNMVK